MKPKSLEQFIEAGKFYRKNQDINDKNFLNFTKMSNEKTELAHFNEVLSSEDILKRLETLNMRPANLKELLQFAIDNPEEQRKYPIVALGSIWRYFDGHRYVPYLWRDGDERGLGLDWYDGGWGGYYRFLAVSSSPLAIGHLALKTSDKVISQKDYKRLLAIHEEALEILSKK